MNRRNLPAYNPSLPDDGVAVYIRDQRDPFSPPKRLRAPDGAPNVLIVLIDDMGFGAPAAFGGPCVMRSADELAAGGLRYSRFHTTAVCSPTRAALMTGRNHHSVGMGSLPGISSGAPGYNTVRPLSAGTIAQTLRYNGYATAMFGKWHQTPVSESTAAGPFDRWPTGEGFEKFYGFLGGLTDQFAPELIEGTTFIDPPGTEEEGYHFSEDIVDQAQHWIRQQRILHSDRPWFTYLAFGATHSPHQVPQAWRDRRRGEFDHGWDVQREVTLRRQKEMGVVPPDTELAPWQGGVPHWDELDETQRAVAARLMENYAAFAEHTDAQVGRLIDFLRARGELDNTLIFYILGDNGASPEGGFEGAFNERRRQSGFDETSEQILQQIDDLGSGRSNPHYPTGWAFALDTPYQWAKLVASHYGGTRNGLIVHWPERIRRGGEIRHQWHHVIDVAPTILEAIGLPHPETIDGVEQDPVEGTSFFYTFDDASAPERHLTQYFEVFGNRGIYHEGWTAVAKHLTPWEFFNPNLKLSFDDDHWELYDTTKDWSQARDLSDEHPDKLAELQALFLAEARRHKVFPLDDRNVIERRAAPEHDLQKTLKSIVLTPRDRHVPSSALPALVNTSFELAVDVEAVPEPSSGVLVAQGSWHCGWSLHVVEGRPVFTYNMLGLDWTHVQSSRALPGGGSRVEFHFDYDGGGRGQGGYGKLLIDGDQVGAGRIERTVPLSIGGSLNIGIDRGSPVTDYPRGDGNPFTGLVSSITVTRADDSVPVPAREVADEILATQ